MKKLSTLLLCLTASFGLFSQCPQNLFFSEIHYDNIGSDLNEGFEIYAPPNLDLSTYKVLLYNGSNGKVYKEIRLSGESSAENKPHFLWFETSMQNGPDALALIDQFDNVLHFISYEGSFSAIEGPAKGLTSLNLPNHESSSTAIGLSLQLAGEGTSYDDFHWSIDEASPMDKGNNMLIPSSYREPFRAEIEIIRENLIHVNFNKSIDIASAINPDNYPGFPEISRIVPSDSSVSLHLLNGIPIGKKTSLSLQNIKSLSTDSMPCPHYQEFLYNSITTGLCISEIHYNPSVNEDLEFVEIYNYSEDSIPLGGLKILDAFEYHFPTLNLGPKSVFVVARDSIKLQEYFGKIEQIGQWTSGSLLNSGEFLSIINSNSDTTALAYYDNTGDWPKLANNKGYSLSNKFNEKIAILPELWFDSQVGEQTVANPGRYVAYQAPFELLRFGLIKNNQCYFVFNDSLPTDFLDFASIHANFPGEIRSQLCLGDSLLLAWTENFPNSNHNRFTLHNFRGKNKSWPLDSEISFAHNASKAKLVVSEIMYNPPEGPSDKYEFIEILNIGYGTANLSALHFTKGIEFTFPDITLAQGEMLVLAKDTTLIAPICANPKLFEYKGSLGNSGEQLRLENSYGDVIFDFKYDDGAKWPAQADGLGSSLELIHATAEMSLASSWSHSINFALSQDSLTYYCSPGRQAFYPEGVVSFKSRYQVQEVDSSLKVELLAKNLGPGVELEINIISPNEEFNASYKQALSVIKLRLDSGQNHLNSNINLGNISFFPKDGIMLYISDIKNSRLAIDSCLYLPKSALQSTELCINEIAFIEETENKIYALELYNPSPSPLLMNHTSLLSNNTKEHFISSFFIPSKAFKIIKLKEQEALQSLSLKMENNETVIMDIPPLSQGESLARESDCDGVWLVSTNPSLGFSNLGNGIKEEKQKQALIYPNPATNFIYRKEEMRDQQWFIQSVDGRIIRTWERGAKQLEIGDIARGVYLVRTKENKLIGRIYR